MSIQDITADIAQKLSGWGEHLTLMLPNLVVAALTVVLFWFAARLACSATDRALLRLDTNAAARGLIARLIRVGVSVAGIMVALGVMNLDKALASVLAGAGVAGLAIGFAFQDLAGNLISGVGLAVHRKWPFKIGDLVETNGVFGVVENIHLRTSMIRSLDGKLVVVPNRHIYQNEVINYTISGRRRIDVSCGVSYAEDLRRVRSVVEDALRGVCGRDDADAVEVFFTGFGDSSIDLVGRFWIDYARQPDFLRARSDAVMAVKAAFDANDITIPFPIRTLDFGIRGGKPLSDELPQMRVALREGAHLELHKEAS